MLNKEMIMYIIIQTLLVFIATSIVMVLKEMYPRFYEGFATGTAVYVLYLGIKAAIHLAKFKDD